jgi:hypothetical protein
MMASVTGGDQHWFRSATSLPLSDAELATACQHYIG